MHLVECCESLRWRKSGAPVRRRQMVALEGLGTSEAVGAFSNTIHNCLAAIVGRVLYRKIEGKYWSLRSLLPESGIFNIELKSFKRVLTPLLPNAAPIALDSFPGLYVGRKRKVYEQALQAYKDRGFIIRDTHIRMFLKYEKDIVDLKPDRIPRVISPAGFVYLLLVGVYLKACEEKIYHAINELFGYKVVAKGVNYSDLGNMYNDSWSSFKDPASIDLDVEKLDASICQEALQWVFEVIGSCFSGNEKHTIMKLLSYQLQSIVKGRADDGWFSYKVKGTLTSGQMNTSLTGVLLVCAILYKVTRKHNLRLINCGDDCTLVGERRQMKGLEVYLHKRFKKFGMVITCSSINRTMEKIQFCQTQPLWINGSVRAVRCLHGALTKDAVSLDKLEQPHRIAAWCRSVGLGGIATHGGVPILQNFYRMYIRSYNLFMENAILSKRQKKRMDRLVIMETATWANWGKPMTEVFSPPDDRTRLSFESAFGVTPTDQLLLEDFYDNFTVSFDKPKDRDMVPNNLSLFLL